MTREEADFIGALNMCDEISNEAYKKIMCHCEEQEPCTDAISRQALKEKLKENHDFFVNAYGGYKNLPPKDKARVDEITNCIAEVVNMPPVTPAEKVGYWIDVDGDNAICGCCDKLNHLYGDYCKHCGTKMQEVEKNDQS